MRTALLFPAARRAAVAAAGTAALAFAIALAAVLAPGNAAAQGAAPAAKPATERRTMGWPLDADGALKVYNFSGRVVVTGWDRDSVAAVATLPAGHTLLGGGGRGGIKVVVEAGGAARGAPSTLELRVPAGANVWVRGGATDVEVHGLIGPLDVGTVNGNVRVSGSPRTLTAESMTGTVDVEASCETLRAKTGSGALTWRGSAADAQLSSVSGPVRVSAGPIERARVETVTGAVTVSSALRSDARLTIETHAGDVELRFPARTPVRLDADAATVRGPGMAPVARAPDGRLTTPHVWEFNIPRGAGAASAVVVRSFSGTLALGFTP